MTRTRLDEGGRLGCARRVVGYLPSRRHPSLVAPDDESGRDQSRASRLNVPIWAGVGAIVGGGLLLIGSRSKLA